MAVKAYIFVRRRVRLGHTSDLKVEILYNGFQTSVDQTCIANCSRYFVTEGIQTMYNTFFPKLVSKADKFALIVTNT